MRPFVGFLVFLFCACAIGCGGSKSAGSTPTSPSTTPTPPAQVCRSYPAQYSLTAEITGSQPQVINVGCSFNSTTSTLRCQHTSSTPGTGSTTLTTTYASVADFVDEGQYIGRTLAQSVASENQAGNRSTHTYRYDGQRRVAGWNVSDNSGGSMNMTATGWDSRGRPSTANVMITTPPPIGLSFTCTWAMSIDDAARTSNLSIGGCSDTRVEAQSFDDTHFPSRVTVTYPQGARLTQSFNVTNRFQVCK